MSPVLPPILNPVNFADPPVGEVALAVQFSGPVTDDSTAVGKFWPRIAEQYPRLEAQPVLPPMSEDFDVSAPTVVFNLMGGERGSRYWFLNEPGTELVQVQPDRLTYNWRKEPADTEYPRYEQLRENYMAVYDALAETADSAELNAEWCEVTYINPIVAADEAGKRRDLGDVLRVLAPLSLTGLPELEDTTYQQRYVLRRDGRPIGRFFINAAPAVRNEDRAPLYIVSLTTRGRPESPDVQGVIRFLDYGRNLIVEAFRELTTDEMHQEWGLEHDGS